VPQAADQEVRLAEFAHLRNEIGQRTTIQQALIALNLTVCGTVMGFVAAEKAPDSLLLAIIYISSTFGILWLDHHLAIHQIARYIERELWDWRPSWEDHLRSEKKPLWWRAIFVLAMILVFAGVSATAAVSVRDDLQGASTALQVIWWAGVAITAITFAAFAATFSLEPARLK
jgi:hypothetical protein